MTASWHDSAMPTGRYAPSPTGTFHLGNLRTAVAAWLFARSSGGDFVLRWEDLDDTADFRHEVTQLADLEALGIDFDPPTVRQSERLDAYRDVISDLDQQGLTYRCWCSRREIREAAAAPHGRVGSYPGTCRDLSARDIAAHEGSSRPPALRLRTAGEQLTITDSLHGTVSSPMDDIVLRRGDGTPAYNLVVVVDDEVQGIKQVVRGDDLLDSTPRHAYLQRLLGLSEPMWTHVPLVTDALGDRLAKRDGSAGLDEWRRAGGTVESLLAAFGRTLGIDVADPTQLPDLLAGFRPSELPLRPTAFESDIPRLSLSD